MIDKTNIQEELFRSSESDLEEVEVFDMEVDVYKKKHKGTLTLKNQHLTVEIPYKTTWTTYRIEISGSDQIDFFDYPIHQN